MTYVQRRQSFGHTGLHPAPWNSPSPTLHPPKVPILQLLRKELGFGYRTGLQSKQLATCLTLPVPRLIYHVSHACCGHSPTSPSGGGSPDEPFCSCSLQSVRHSARSSSSLACNPELSSKVRDPRTSPRPYVLASRKACRELNLAQVSVPHKQAGLLCIPKAR